MNPVKGFVPSEVVLGTPPIALEDFMGTPLVSPEKMMGGPLIGSLGC